MYTDSTNPNYLQEMLMNKKIFAGLLVLVLATLACGLPSNGGTTTDSNVLFQDDFSDTGSGWATLNDSDGVMDYSNGAFQMMVSSSDLLLFTTAGQNLQADVVVDVDTYKAGGPDDNAFGLICRYVDTDNFYFFVISSDGYAAIAKYVGNELTILTGDGVMETTDAINQGAASNHITASCVGSTLTLTVNGTQLYSITDTSFSSGDVGFVAKSFSEGGVDITFDDLVVTKP